MNNYSDIYNMIDLYLNNEKESKKANLNIIKDHEQVIFKLNMNSHEEDKTTFTIPIIAVNDYISNILKIYKNKELIIDEKYELDSKNKMCHYRIKFQNGRVITFDNFSIIEINNIRNILYNIEMHKEEIRVEQNNKNIEMNYRPRLLETGFSSSKSMFLIVIFLLIVLFASLLIFKIFIK